MAGCVADDGIDPSGEPGSGGGPTGTAGPGEAAMVPYRFSADAPNMVTLSLSDTFDVTSYCFPLGCLLGDGFEVVVDLTPFLPVGVPVRLDLVLEHDHEIMGNIGGEFVSEGIDFLHFGEGGPYGELHVLAIVVRPSEADTLDFVVRAQFPDAASERGWQLDVMAHSHPDTVPPAVPTLLTIPDRSAPPRFNETREGGPVHLLLWGPDDSFLGRFGSGADAEEAIRGASRGGDFVMLVPLGAEPISVLWNGSGAAPALKPLTLTREFGDYHEPLVHEEAVEWSFQVDRMPVAVGIDIRVADSYAAQRLSASIAREGTDVLGLTYECGLCLGLLSGASPYFEAATAPGSESVVTGEYGARFTLDGVGLEATHFVVHYAR